MMPQTIKRLTYRFLLVVAGTLCFSSTVSAADLATSSARISHDLKYLASDELEGRGVGTEGLDKAAEYVREQFREAGLDVTQVEGGAFQSFMLPSGSELQGTNSLVLNGPEDKKIELKLGKDFQVCSFGGAGVVDAELVFVGYGIENKDLRFDEYASVDMKDKLVVIMRRTPGQGKKDSPFQGHHGGISRDAELRTKVSRAYGHGAAGILFVNDPFSGRSTVQNAQAQVDKAEKKLTEAVRKFLKDESDETKNGLKQASNRLENLEEVHGNLELDTLMEFGYAGTGKKDDLPIAHLSIEMLNQVLLSGLGKSLAELEAEIDLSMQPKSTRLKGWTARLETNIRLKENQIHNVIGVLEGEGPLADETIVIGAHYDHVGFGGKNSRTPNVKEVHNGADDNGSGTVALIELARRFASAEKPPSRRLVFIAFTAEELGLIGSAHYVKEPVFPLDKTIAMFNMDMVGRLSEDKLTVFGTGTSSRWKPLVVKEGEASKFRLSMQPEGFGPSDHSSFYGKKIPVLHFFTGTHADYHKPTDDVEKINTAGIVRVADLIETLVHATLANEQKPDYVEIAQRANISRSGSRPYFGSIPDFGSEGTGYALSGVSPESPADKAGLKAGDSIIQVGETKIGGLDDFDLALRRFSAGDEVEVIVVRDGKQVKSKVTLAHPK